MAEAAHDLREELRNAVSRADESGRETVRLEALLASMPRPPAPASADRPEPALRSRSNRAWFGLSPHRLKSHSLSFIREMIRRPRTGRIHLKAWSKARIILSSGVFDEQWYLDHYPDVRESDVAPVHHYVVFGETEGRSPNPLFDAQWYLEQYPDVAQQQVSPFLHFCRYGAVERRSPNPWFDSNWYFDQYPDVAGERINPLAHYMKHGAAEGRNPHPCFDTAWYLRQNPDVASSPYNPLFHYLNFGRPEGRLPREDFGIGTPSRPASMQQPAMSPELPALQDNRPSKYDVLVLANISWSARFQRPQQIAVEFARQGHRVFYIVANPPSSTAAGGGILGSRGCGTCFSSPVSLPSWYSIIIRQDLTTPSSLELRNAIDDLASD